jgi:uncharacterized protein
MKKLLVFLFILASSALYAQEVNLPYLSGPVVDTINLLTTEQSKTLSEKSLSLQRTKGSQIAVCIVPTTAPLTIEEYGIKLGEKWKIGRAKIADGIIIIVAKDDRKMRIEVGRGLEGTVTDLLAGRIIDNIMKPEFKKGDFFKGLDGAMDALVALINGSDVPGVTAAVPSTDTSYSDPTDTFEFKAGIGFMIGSFLIFIILTALGKMVLSTLITYGLMFAGNYLMGVGLAGEVAAITGFCMIPLVLIALGVKYGGGSSSGSSYSSGTSYSSSDYSSSSSSPDSYSGGGGDFGGGGSSGDW